ncbi:hypothetical protein AAAV70_28815 [Hungatella hathewayi]|uniref:hypothetical protein n=1 Tax=Hungatella hathewayi TaxID=154046 RepID=UPI00206C3B98|nr:MAG TPA: Hemolysin [Caudoviricetes sp.]
MPTEIMVALIGLGGSAIGTFTGVFASAKLTAYRLEQLEKKVDRHNTVIERTYKLEEAQAVMQEQIKVVNHRIGDLERED